MSKTNVRSWGTFPTCQNSGWHVGNVPHAKGWLSLALVAWVTSFAIAADPIRPTEKPARSIFVPFEDMNVLLEGSDQRVLLTRQEYEELLGKAKLVPPAATAPRDRLLLSAVYDGVIQDGRASIRATMELESLSEELLALPLPMRGATLRTATLDGRAAPLGRGSDGLPTLFLQGRGRHVLEIQMLVPLQTSAAQQSLQFQLPLPAATQWRLTAPGNVEVKSGAEVIRREVDQAANLTKLELLPQRDQTTIVLSLNNRILLEQQVVLARSVLLDELTQSYDRLHATISLAIPHGAVDRFRFELPAGFEVTDASTPLLARWAVEKGEGEARILEVLLREATRETVVLNVVAVSHQPRYEAWSMPQLRPLNVASHVAVIGVLAEDRLVPKSLNPIDLIPIDTTVLTAALPSSIAQPEPGAPRLRPIAAYYAPQADFQLQASYRREEARFEVTSNLLFTMNDRQLQLRAGFALRPKTEPLFAAEMTVPKDWQVTEVTHTDGTKLPFELFPEPNNTTRLQVRLPHGAPPGQFFQLFVQATSTPAGWLGDWSQTMVALPVFAIGGAERDVGAVAVQMLDDLVARPEQLSGLAPLDEKEKSEFGLGTTSTSLAYRYESQPYSAMLNIERPQPRLTARTFHFLRLEPEGLLAHYELVFQIDRARARRLTLSLPASTPEALAIRGIDVPVKEFHQGDPAGPMNGERTWVVELAEPRSGSVRLAVDFQQSLPTAATGLPLPLVRAVGVVYQSGTVAVEGSAEFDVRVNAPNVADFRKVDVGELVDAQYQVGKRLLGAFGFVGEPGIMTASISRRQQFGLPSAIVQRAELVTIVSSQGLCQTAARFQLRTKAPFLEIALPANSTLWSATVGGQPASPQRDKERLLISLASTGTDALRDLQLVYETPSARWMRWGTFTAGAPRLLLRDEEGKNRAEVPLTDLEWHLVLPDGQRLIRFGGSVFPSQDNLSRSPAVNAVGVAVGSLGFLTLPARSVESTESARPTPYFRTDDLQAFPAPAAAEPMSAEPASGPTNPPTNQSVAESKTAEESPPMRGMTASGAFNPKGLSDAKQPPGEREKREMSGTVPESAAAQSAQTTAIGKNQFWALQGIRSLPVELADAGDRVTFHSLGVDPRLHVTVANSQSLDFLAAGLALVVGFLGLRMTSRSTRRKIPFVITAGALLLAAPLLIGLFTDLELTNVFAPAFYVVCGMSLWYLLVGFARLSARGAQRLFGRAPDAIAAAAVVGLFLMTPPASAQESTTLDNLRQLLAPPLPPRIPSDAVLIPYNPDDPQGIQKATKVFVPYADYEKLWNRAYPERPLTTKPPRTPYAVGGMTYTATLEGEDFLSVIGRLEVEVFAEGTHQILLPVRDAVLTRVTVDGQPARLQVIQPTPVHVPLPIQQSAGETFGRTSGGVGRPAPNMRESPQPETAPTMPHATPNASSEAQQAAAPNMEAAARPIPAEPIPAVLVEGKGRKQVELELRFRLTRTGGWHVVAGRLPSATATALNLLVPAAKTQVRIGAVANNTQLNEWETQQDQQTIESALGVDGELQLQWRPKIAETQIDQSLTARSVAVLDIQEDALRLTWQTTLRFRSGLRDTFTLIVPRDMLLEKVLGANVRGWKSTPDGESAKVDVTLLKSATGSEQLTLLLSKRTAVGAGEMAGFAAPAVGVADAALHQGILVVRRSPLLEVRVGNATGLSRADAQAAEVAAVLANVSEDSPLGIQPFQTYRFAALPFTLQLTASPYTARTTVEVQTLLKVADREHQYEAKLDFTVASRPKYSVQCRLPVGLRLDEVTASTKFTWTTSPASQDPANPNAPAQGEVLNVFLQNGQQQFSLVIRGRFPKANTATFPVPNLQVLDVERQSGQLVVQADPGYDVRAEELRGCENVLLEQVFGWLNEDQRRLARFALAYRSPDFAATLRVAARVPRVHCFTITNSRLTPTAIEDTIYLQFSIADAGIRTVQFQVPEALRDARLTVPLLRQKTVETVADQPGRLRFTLELQDEVTESLIVLLQNDRPLTGSQFETPIPVVETGSTDQRFVVLESAGRDEVVVTAAEQMMELNRQESQWAKLAATIGDKMMRAYLVREDATQPRLVVQTKQRATIETAGARIGLAKTLLVVDGYGAYRGVQEYFVDNKTEQYLEIELPAGAELWTTRVAGEPVKPVAPPDATTTAGIRRVFVPLIKTAAGDLDYTVELKYGGRLVVRNGISRVHFPLMHTKNIRVELSQVRLRLPESRQWFDFDGSMRHVRDEGDLLAGIFSYKSKQVEQLLDVVRGAESFSKVRAANNLKQLGLGLQAPTDAYRGYLQNSDFQREFANNSGLLQQAEQLLQQQAQAPQQEVITDNRSQLLLRCENQTLTRSKNVVTQLDENFKAADIGEMAKDKTSTGQPGQAGQQFNLKWFEGNRLQVQEQRIAQPTKGTKLAPSRVDFDDGSSLAITGKPTTKDETAQAANELGRKLADSTFEADTRANAGADEKKAEKQIQQGRDGARSEGLNEQLERYQLRLEQNLPGQGFGMGGMSAAAGSLGGGLGGLGGSPSVGDAVASEPGLATMGRPAVALAGMTSLDVSIPERGVEYRFVTPGGEIAITARAMESHQLQRLFALGLLLGGLAALWVVRRILSHFTRPAWHSK